MRYNNRVTLIRLTKPEDDLHGTAQKNEVHDVPSLTIPVTDTNELAAYGLLNRMAYEIHLKNAVPLVDRVRIDGIEYTVNKTFVNRKSTVLIVSGGGNNG